MKPTSLVLISLGLAISTSSMAQRPRVPSRVVVKGLSAKAEILVDRWGVPHIYAHTPRDAFVAQGWNAARDRLWQIDMWRRTGLGEAFHRPSWISTCSPGRR